MNCKSINPSDESAADTGKPAKRISPYRRLLECSGRGRKGGGISTGAFRYWHILHDGKDRDGRCWLGRRAILRDFNLSFALQKDYTSELTAGGWLQVEAVELNGKPNNRGHAFVYTLLNGEGQPLKSTATETSSSECYHNWKRSNRYRNRKRGVSKRGSAAIPNPVAKDTSNSKEGQDSKVVLVPASLGIGDSASHSPTCSAEKATGQEDDHG
jgi:hypothetical protein